MSVDSPPKKPKMLTLNKIYRLLVTSPTRMDYLRANNLESNQSVSSLKVRRWYLLSMIATLLCSLVPATGFGEPWVNTGDEQTRHHLQNLSDSGLLSSPITSWPITWSNIKSDLDDIRPKSLSGSQLWSYRYLKHELRKAMSGTHVEQTVHLSNHVSAISDFSTDSRDKVQSTFAIGKTGVAIAYKLKASYVYDPADGQKYRGDGSYINYLTSNWVVGAGMVDRWWGPGWESSLILSNSARPLPSIYLQRNLATPFDIPLLKLLGPWQVTSFMSQLESSAAIPKAKLWGMRVNIKPLKQLEIGLSRTAQWGGEGRSNDLDTFIDLVLGKDNLDDFDADETIDRSKEPGNQLAGIDWRWGQTFGGTGASLYGQFIGEDEAGGMPSRSIGMAGVEVSGLLWDVHTRVNLEAQNTTVYFYDSDKVRGNVAYEHSIYRSGYRYYGRPIGASTDNDSESVTLRTQLFFRNGSNINVAFGHHRLNLDGSNTPLTDGGSIFGELQKNTYKTQINYVSPINDHLLIEIGAFDYSTSILYGSVKITTGGYIKMHAYY
jgi:Capsule assembly protein Wzi